MNADATSNPTLAGISTQRGGSGRVSSAKPPLPTETATRSPILRLVTPWPSDLTTPEISPPGSNGSGGLHWYLAASISTSGKFTPQAFAVTSTLLGPGVVDGSSRSSISSGGPQYLQSRAF